jgi:DNA (cytosine-5)-methyltransferase 1
MRLLDLFCGAGGAAVGYHRAGFDEIVGVDIKPMPRYPFQFVQADALEFCKSFGVGFDVIHASPPCQGYSALRCLPWLRDKVYPMLIEPCREALEATGRPFVIENVERAPLRNGLTLCGQMFGLSIYRHRQFECSEILLSPGHKQHDVVIGAGRMLNDRRKGTLNAGSAKGAWGKQPLVTVAGGQCRKDDAERALGIDWMQKHELMQAIPPAYTEFIGKQLIEALS